MMFKKLFSFIWISALLTALVWPWQLAASSIDVLREQLEASRSALQDTEAKISKFRDEVTSKQREARTLEQQIGLIDENIEEVELQLEQTLLEVETTGLEIDAVAEDINVREQEISEQKIVLANYIRSIHELDQQSSVTIFLKYRTFSEAAQEVSAFEELQNRGQESLDSIQELRDELTAKQSELEKFKTTLQALHDKQEQEQNRLASQRSSKQRILGLTSAQESKFQDLLQKAKAAHQQAQADIRRLDTLIREQLKNQGLGNLPSVGVFDWPINPIFGISCEFHCSGYPYAYLIGPHSGIDIPAAVGTAIRAPADGYIARTHDAGGPGYSYILLLHGDEISTVYGHVSGFAVSEGQTVTRGTVLGYTGGAPGSHGAGLSTGGHLHFEVRQNNAPINPRQYL